MTLAAGRQHRGRIDQIDHPGRPPRWAQPHDSSTSPCETLAACLRRSVPAGRRASRLGYLADLALADPRRGHPVALFGRGAAGLERFTYSDDRRAAVRIHTARCSVCWRSVGAAGSGPLAAGTGIDGRGHGGGDVRRAGRHVADAHRRADGRPVVDGDDIDGGAATAAVAVRARPRRSGRAGLTRAALESVAENTSDAQVAPLLWAAVGGVPALLVYRGANTLDAMIGHRSPRYRAIRLGRSAIR